MKTNFEQPGSSRRILLVAADVPFREESVSALCEAGYCAEGECDTELAWEALSRQGYELVVVDHQLPGRSGLRLVLRMSHANLTLPVVLVTEALSPFGLPAHERLHAITILPRPFGTERLLEIVFVALSEAKSVKSPQHRQSLLEAGTQTKPKSARGVLKHGKPKAMVKNRPKPASRVRR